MLKSVVIRPATRSLTTARRTVLTKTSETNVARTWMIPRRKTSMSQTASPYFSLPFGSVQSLSKWCDKKTVITFSSAARRTKKSSSKKQRKEGTDKNKSKKKGKSKKGKQKKQPKFQYSTHGLTGRLLMTKARLDNPKVASLQLTTENAKNLVNRIKHKLLLHLQSHHASEGPDHEQFFISRTTWTAPEGILGRIPEDALVLEDGSVQLESAGAARSKKQAEFMCAVDMILHLTECGIDPYNLPNVRSLLRQKEKQQFLEQLEHAQMILDLFSVSMPRFSTEEQIRGGFISTVTMYYKGIPLQASGEHAPNKKMAEGQALIAAAGAPLEELVGTECLQKYKALIEASPAQQLAVLRVPPLDDEAFGLLDEAIFAYQEERIEQHAVQVARFKQRHQHHRSRRKRQPVSKVNSKAISETLLNEEKARWQRIADNPDGELSKIQRIRDALPIKAIREDLIESLAREQVVVISGGTGSGKTTQCGQYILEDAIANGKGANTRIVVTQPRRIAAISVAERVAVERGEEMGNSVGYTVRFNRNSPRELGGSIEFVTTGVLLRRLVNDPELEGISHVMIDEVHERDISSDFLLVLLRDLVTRNSDLRVILMSATLDSASFAAYFSREAGNVPMLSVPPKPRHPVDVVYLEDLAGESVDMISKAENLFPAKLKGFAQSLLEFHDQQLLLEMEEASAEEAAAARLEPRSLENDEDGLLSESDSDSDSSSDEDEAPGKLSRAMTLRHAVSTRKASTGRSITAASAKNQAADKREIGEITVSLIAEVAQYVARTEIDEGRRGSILCFLPGWDEIKDAMDILEDCPESQKDKMVVLPLHSTIPQDDQQRVFKPAADGTVKVILATNIAESSVTIDDVLAVVDSGLVREMNFDAESVMSKMETVPTSRASATQRLGRAGRVAPGKCYRLYSRGALQAMFERPTPEIQRTALESTCLQTCTMTNESVKTFLRRAMDPPREESMNHAMDRLVSLGAIDVDPSCGRESLSPLGNCLSRLPLDPATGRMLIMGCVLQCLDPVLTAAAQFGSRDVFYTPPEMRKEQRIVRQSFSDTSDLMANIRAFDEFRSLLQEEGWTAARQWASDNFISIAAMNTIHSTRSQLLNELNRIGLVHKNDIASIRSKHKILRSDAMVNKNSGIESLHRAIWAAGLPDNLAARRGLGSFGTLRSRTEQSSGLHPSSVAFHRKPPKDKSIKLPPWFLYREMILSSQVFLRGCTAIKPEHIVIFGGYKLNAVNATRNENVNNTSVRLLDDWVVVEGTCQDTIDLLANARQEIQAALDFKVMNPRKPLPEASQSIIDAICEAYDILDDQD